MKAGLGFVGKATPFFQELLFLLFSFYLKCIQRKKKHVLPDRDYSKLTVIMRTHYQIMLEVDWMKYCLIWHEKWTNEKNTNKYDTTSSKHMI